jgi:hypothetical protein
LLFPVLVEIDPTAPIANHLRRCSNALQGCERLRHRELKYCQPCARGISRRMREAVLRDCGLVKVRGAQGGTYWE